MSKSFFDNLRAKRASSPSVDRDFVVPQTSLVEEIWSSWRYGALTPSKLENDAPFRSESAAPLRLENDSPPRSESETSPKPESKPDLTSDKPAERVNQLKRMGKYEDALRVALAEVRLEEERGPSVGARPMVPWYYWEAASIYRKLKRYDDEVTLVRRFARNHGINFRAFSKRYRSTPGAQDAWARKFLERLETAKVAGAQAQDVHQPGTAKKN
jgi:ribosomal protein S19E (S16A)